MSDMVLVALPRSIAEGVVDDGKPSHRAQVNRAIRAALNTDREEQVELIAGLIHAGVTGQDPTIGGPEDLADAVLSVLEGADDE